MEVANVETKSCTRSISMTCLLGLSCKLMDSEARSKTKPAKMSTMRYPSNCCVILMTRVMMNALRVGGSLTANGKKLFIHSTEMDASRPKWSGEHFEGLKVQQ